LKNLKFKSASFSNRKKQLEALYTSGKKITLHYGELGIAKLLKTVNVDEETKGKSLILTFVDNSVAYLPYDQPLALGRDPEYLLQLHIERIIAKIKESIAKKGISKRFLAEKLKTSDNQIQRLLDPSILNKNLSQLYRVADIVGLTIQFDVLNVA
jgi:hypothetical protein